MDYLQIELSLDIASVPATFAELRSPQYYPYWYYLSAEALSTCKSVGEQVANKTKESAHQHEYTHFIETYWVERKNQKYWYYRYAWMNGRKMSRKYIGSVNSSSKYKCTLMVKELIEANFSPNEIVRAIAKFNNR